MEKESINKLIESLEKNGIAANFFESSAEAVKYLENTLTKGATVTLGGSISVVESGVFALLKNGNYNLLDRMQKGLTPEQRENCYKAAIGCDYFFCSANAISMDGKLINVDGMGNRISSIIFGPKKVFMIVGVNKIVETVNEGFLRIKKIAAPKNCVRLQCDTPCAKLGKCISLTKSDNPDLSDGCMANDKICRHFLVSGKQKENGRIEVILINENLGY